MQVGKFVSKGDANGSFALSGISSSSYMVVEGAPLRLDHMRLCFVSH